MVNSELFTKITKNFNLNILIFTKHSIVMIYCLTMYIYLNVLLLPDNVHILLYILPDNVTYILLLKIIYCLTMYILFVYIWAWQCTWYVKWRQFHCLTMHYIYCVFIALTIWYRLCALNVNLLPDNQNSILKNLLSNQTISAPYSWCRLVHESLNQ